MLSEQVEWASRLSRVGWAAKGIVHIIIGALTSMAVFGLGGAISGKGDAFKWIVGLPAGKILLVLIALGLMAYVLWRIIQAIADPERKGSDAKAILQRIGYAISGLAYAGVAVYAVRLAIGGNGGGASTGNEEGGTRQFIVASVLQQPAGEWLVGAAALVLIGIGMYQIYRAITNKFKKQVDMGRMNDRQRRAFTAFGNLGFVARGIVLGIIGFLLIQAALHSDPSQAQGTEGAFQFLRDAGYGPWLLGAVAIGLIAYGLFCLVRSRHQRIRTNG